MDWDKWMEGMELSLLCMAILFFVLCCLRLLATKPVVFFIGHVLLLFPAFRRYVARKQTEEFFRWWDEHYLKGITARFYYQDGDGEWQLSSTTELAPDPEVNPPEKPGPARTLGNLGTCAKFD